MDWKHCGLFLDTQAKADLYTDGLRDRCRDFDVAAPLRALYNRPAGATPLERALYVDFKMYLPDDLLVKVDRTSMAHGLEVRSPLLDAELIELAARLPMRWKLAGGEAKLLLKRVARRHLPGAIVERRKHGFTAPLADWLRTSLRAAAQELVTGARAAQRGLFETAALRRLWDEHQSGAADHAEALWALMNLELWQREYL